VDLVRPFVVGLSCCVAGAVVGLLLVLPFSDSDVEDLPLYLLVSGPIGLGAFVGGGLAARTHREPERRDPRRHFVAALNGPLVFAVFNSVGVSPDLDAVWLVRLFNLVLPIVTGYAGLRLLDHSTPPTGF
jgi:hypothetical protein